MLMESLLRVDALSGAMRCRVCEQQRVPRSHKHLDSPRDLISVSSARDIVSRGPGLSECRSAPDNLRVRQAGLMRAGNEHRATISRPNIRERNEDIELHTW